MQGRLACNPAGCAPCCSCAHSVKLLYRKQHSPHEFLAVAQGATQRLGLAEVSSGVACDTVWAAVYRGALQLPAHRQQRTCSLHQRSVGHSLGGMPST